MMRELKTDFWLATRLLKSRQGWSLGATGWLALSGLILGVGSLVVSMAVMSGYASTLQKNVADVTGHIQVLRMGAGALAGNKEDASEKWKNEPQIKSFTSFLFLEGVLAREGKLSGVFLQGIEKEKIQEVLGLHRRVVAGQLDLNSDGIPLAVIGKTLAEQFHLKPGDEFKIVIPQYSEESTKFRRELATLRVAALMDLGKVEYDERMIIVDLPVAQKISHVGDRSSGYLIKTDNIEKARGLAQKLAKTLGPEYRVRDWHDINENLFDAVVIEKIVVFFVIFIIVLASAFNVSISLYVSVVKKYADISILKSFGLPSWRVMRVFSFQGLVMGLMGSVLGLMLGILFCYGFTFLETQWGLLPASIYRIDRIEVSLRFWDVFTIIFTSVIVCFLAALSPAKKGSQLTAVEGLKYD